jgi:hypothetical protein
MTAPTPADDKSWMLKHVASLSGVCHALVSSADGLVVTHTPHTDPATADTLAAACSSLLSLGRHTQAAAGSTGDLRQIMVENDDRYLFVRRASKNTHLTVATTMEVDPELIAHGMLKQITILGQRLDTPALS